MKPLSSGPRSMRGSGIREIMNQAATMTDVLHVEVGEPDFPTPPHIVEAAHRAALDGYTRYTPNQGLLSVRMALVDKLHRLNKLSVSPEQITVTHGAVSGLMTAMAALVEAGDEVLLPDPGWPNYELMVRILGGVPVRYRLSAESSFLPEPEALAVLITPRTKVLLLNSPSNPAGTVYPRELVEQLVSLAVEHDLWVISDEVYEEIVFEGEHVSPAIYDTDGRVISVYSFSKTYAMTGWRVGYVVASSLVSEVMSKLQEPFISCASSVSQKAAEAALLGPQVCVGEMRAAYRRRRDMLVELLRANEMFTYEPQGAFYALVDVSPSGEDTYDFARHMLRSYRVAVAPGEAFGPSGRGLVRVALCAADETIQRAVEALAEAVHDPETPPEPAQVVYTGRRKG